MKHKHPLSDDDIILVGQYIKNQAKTDPYHLQRSVWFLHNFTGAARGIEVYKELLVKDVTIDKDEDGEYVQISKDRLIKSKTYQGGINKKSRDSYQVAPKIYEINHDVCFVKLMKFYLSKMRKYILINPKISKN